MSVFVFACVNLVLLLIRVRLTDQLLLHERLRMSWHTTHTRTHIIMIMIIILIVVIIILKKEKDKQKTFSTSRSSDPGADSSDPGAH